MALVLIDDICAIIPTRGDVDLTEILASLIFTEVVVWDNSKEEQDWGAFGRYRAIGRTMRPVVYFQDDDCVVPTKDQWRLVDSHERGILTALMPPERTDYQDTVLIGWGSICDWNLPGAAFRRWQQAGHRISTDEFRVVGCDFVFPILTPHRRLDSRHRDLPHAHAANRTWGSWPNYRTVKEWYLTEGRAIRDQ